MELLLEPQVWLSFLTLALLEIVLGIDNIIFLSLLVNRLPARRRKSARLLGLSFAMLTRIALLFSISWLTTLRHPLFFLGGLAVAGRDMILMAGGAFLLVNSVMEIRTLLDGAELKKTASSSQNFWLIILEIGFIDIVFSLDSIFAAIGLAQRVSVMVAAIVCSVLVMMWVSQTVSEFIDRHPRIKVLALAFLVLVGGSLVAQSLHWTVPNGYLYFAMGFAGAVEWLNIRTRNGGK